MSDTLELGDAVDTERLMVVSSDCHAGPPMTAFREYIPRRYLEPFDEYARMTEAYDRRLKDRFETWGNTALLAAPDRNEVVGLWDPTARLGDLEAEGVVAEVIYPQGAIPFHTHPPNVSLMPPMVFPADGEMRATGVRTYNRWLADFCNAHPGRHAGSASCRFGISRRRSARSSGLPKRGCGGYRSRPCPTSIRPTMTRSTSRCGRPARHRAFR